MTGIGNEWIKGSTNWSRPYEARPLACDWKTANSPGALPRAGIRQAVGLKTNASIRTHFRGPSLEMYI
jgi:hypothetical protein